MLDPKWIRSEPEALAKRLLKKKYSLNIEWLAELDGQRKQLQLETENLQNERNTRSKAIGKAKAAGENVDAILQSMEQLKTELETKKELLNALQLEFHSYLMGVPNVPDESVPPGNDESGNMVVSTWGEPKQFDFAVKDHAELGEGLAEGLDFATAAKITGSRFVVMRGQVALLHRALIQFMLNTHTLADKQYTNNHGHLLARRLGQSDHQQRYDREPISLGGTIWILSGCKHRACVCQGENISANIESMDGTRPSRILGWTESSK